MTVDVSVIIKYVESTDFTSHTEFPYLTVGGCKNSLSLGLTLTVKQRTGSAVSTQ